MPELPEVETIVSDLNKKLVGHKIQNVDFLWPGLLREMSVSDFLKLVNNKQIEKVERRAKNIRIELNEGLNLLIHLKMTGHLIYADDSWQVDKTGHWIDKGHKKSPLLDPLNQSIRAIFYLDKGKILAFSDIRKFAYLKLLDDKSVKDFFAKYGPEPFSPDFNIAYLSKIFGAKRLAIKKVLMDQALIAGIGNIYADEILHLAKIHPLTKASNLSQPEIQKIYDATKAILAKAIEKRGTSTSDFRDAEGKKGSFGEVLAVYRRTGQPCSCGDVLKRITVGGRGTHFCPKCQVYHD